jgi:hypothetical protein
MFGHQSDTHPKIEAIQLELFRQASPARKLAMMGELNRTVKTLALNGLKTRYPEDSPEILRRRLADLLLGTGLACKVYGPLFNTKE